MRELPRKLSAEELAGLFEGRTRFVEQLAELSDPLGRARELAAQLSDEEKKELLDATEHAVKAGVFGAPTWVVDGKELFWGQDRLQLVERELAR